MYIKCIVIGAILILVPTPVNAQYQWCYDWSCQPYQSPARQQYQQPVKHHSSQVKSKERTIKEERPVKVTRVVKVEKVVRQGKEKTWQDMSQDDAREWIKGEIQGFCGKYPKDEACQQKKNE